jgi:hypothetical protein
MSADRLAYWGPNVGGSYPWECVLLGEGRLRITLGGAPCLGIYRQDGDRLAICFRDPRQRRPMSFRAGDDQHLLILRRVRPGK